MLSIFANWCTIEGITLWSWVHPQSAPSERYTSMYSIQLCVHLWNYVYVSSVKISSTQESCFPDGRCSSLMSQLISESCVRAGSFSTMVWCSCYCRKRSKKQQCCQRKLKCLKLGWPVLRRSAEGAIPHLLVVFVIIIVSTILKQYRNSTS